MSNASQENSTQLPLSVNVSPWSGFKHLVNKFVREFKYTPLVQVLTSFYFWVNIGLLGVIYWFLSRHAEILNSGRGVTIIPGGKSTISVIVSRSVTDLTVLSVYWQGMVAIVILVTVVGILLHWSGRSGILPYLFLVSLFLLLMISKVIIRALLILGD